MNKNYAIHLVITYLCNRKCKYCCNNQYDIKNLEIATDEEYRNTDRIYLTGGEPFAYAIPNNYAKYLKNKYPNIKKVCVYTNAFELNEYLKNSSDKLDFLDGLSVSIKNNTDLQAFNEFSKDCRIQRLNSNRLYVFDNKLTPKDLTNFMLIHRKWQKIFVPADNCIFRRF